MKIECYNERNARSCNVRLTNLVETVNAAGINISLPQGVIKLNISPLITHLKFMFHGVQWIVKVTNRVSLGNDLYNISYSIDWLKDYWLKYADNTGHYMIARTTVDSLINPMLTDGERSFSADSCRETTVGSLIDITWCVAAVVSISKAYLDPDPAPEDSPSTYLMNISQWINFQKEIVSNTDFQNAILRVFLVPYSAYIAAPGAIVDTINVPSAEDAGYHAVIFAGDNKPKQLKPKTIIKQTLNPGVTIDAANWFDLRTKAHTLYIPGIGDVSINPQITGALSTVELWYNMTDGVISATINNAENTRTAANTLPSVSWVTSAAPLAIKNIETQFITGATTMAVSAIATGGTNVLGLAAGAMGLGINALASKENALYGATSSAQAVGWDMVYRPNFVLSTVYPKTVLTDSQQKAAYGLPAGKPVEHLSDLAPGYYWLDCSNALIYGGSDYESAYRQALHNVRINVN